MLGGAELDEGAIDGEQRQVVVELEVDRDGVEDQVKAALEAVERLRV
jgi:hypothetical protein